MEVGVTEQTLEVSNSLRLGESYDPENGVGSPVSRDILVSADKNIYHELIAELRDVEIHFGDTETEHNERRDLTSGT